MPTNRHIAKQEAEIYATTLLDNANETGGVDAVLDVLSQVEAIVAYNRAHIELTDALSDLAYTPEQRVQLVKGTFADCHPVLSEVLGVMAERVDIDQLPRVWDSYRQQISDRLNVTVVDVTTAVELDDELRKVIKEKVASDLGGTVVLRESVDKSILGGIIMTANSKRIDASMLTQLESARQVLKKTTDGGEC